MIALLKGFYWFVLMADNMVSPLALIRPAKQTATAFLPNPDLCIPPPLGSVLRLQNV